MDKNIDNKVGGEQNNNEGTPSLMGGIFQNAKERINKELGDMGRDLVTRALENPGIHNEAVKFGGGVVAEEVLGAVKEAKNNTVPIIEKVTKSLTNHEQSTLEMIEAGISPNGGFFGKIFARLVYVGARISAFVGALMIDNWTGRDEKDQNAPNIEKILGWLVGGFWWKKKDEKKQNLSPSLQPA